MGLFGNHHPDDSPTSPAAEPTHRDIAAGDPSDDELEVERYRYLLRALPPATIEQVHAEAFATLTPAQRDLLFDRLTDDAPSASEQPADARPETLAKAAARAEARHPGALASALAGGHGEDLAVSYGTSLLGAVAGFVIASTLVSAVLPPEPDHRYGALDADDLASGDALGLPGFDGGGFDV
jgi:hypothetical protein